QSMPKATPEKHLRRARTCGNDDFAGICQLLKPIDVQQIPRQVNMHALAPTRTATQILGDLVTPGDGNQLGIQCLTEDACLAIALDTRQRASAQGSVNMDVAVGEKFRPGTHRSDDGQVAAL